MRIRIKRFVILIMMTAVIIGAVAPGMNSYAAVSATKISGYTAPKALTEGQAFVLKGKITSDKTIKRVEVGVVYNNGLKWTGQKYDNKSVNAKSFDIAKADLSVRFGKIKAGTYIYRIYAHTSDNKVHTLVNKQFTVKSKTKVNTTTKKTVAASATNKKTTAASKSTTAKKTTTKETSTVQKNTITIAGGNKPSKYKVGKTLKVKGTIKSTEKINRVEIGIVIDATNKWTEYKYDNKSVNSKTFNISKAASKLRFDKLPGGKFRYRIYAHTASGVKIVLDHPFTVTPSNKPQAAVNWAVKIANDNSFTYGAKPAANAIGCYFCGTNCGPTKHYKPKGYEKTYVCLTFAGAAYAHGAKDPEILAQCQKGRMTMYETDDNFTKFSCWMKIGACKDLKIEDLQPGDILVQWSDNNDNNGHVCIYMGNNSIVEASGGGWNANSIAVKTGVAASRLKSLSSNKKNYVMRYIH